jgi:hypothetical protein
VNARGIAIALCAASAPALADDVPPTPPPTPPPATPTPPPAGNEPEDQRLKLNKQVGDFDWQQRKATATTAVRAKGLFVGASFAFAASARLEIDTTVMDGTASFPAAYSAELQAGYRVSPNLSVALVPQMFFNLRPDDEDAARGFGVFTQATGHLVVHPRWDLDVFAAPGFSVLILPGADNASGLAFRWGGGAAFHLSQQVSVALELSHQIGLQKTERAGSDVGMQTSFVSLLSGIRFSL